MTKLKITNAEIAFANLKDEGFGRSLTIYVDQKIGEAISKFWSDNQIGNAKTQIGVPNYKEYEGRYQVSLKINDSTKYAGLNGLTIDDLGYGAVVDIVLNAFEYNNKFTSGNTYVGASISAVLIKQGGKTGGDADLNELLSDYEDQ